MSGVEFHHKNITHVPGQIYNFSKNLQCIPGVMRILSEKKTELCYIIRKKKIKKKNTNI